MSGGSWPALAKVEDPGVEVQDARQDRDEQTRSALVDQDVVRSLERLDGIPGPVQRGPHDRPDEGHQERRGDALPGDIRDDHAEVARSGLVEEGEDVEEVPADGARRAVVAGDLPAVGLDPGDDYEGSLDPLGDLQLALDELFDLELPLDEVGVGGRRSGSLEGGD